MPREEVEHYSGEMVVGTLRQRIVYSLNCHEMTRRMHAAMVEREARATATIATLRGALEAAHRALLTGEDQAWAADKAEEAYRDDLTTAAPGGDGEG